MKPDYQSVIRTLIRRQESEEAGSAAQAGQESELTTLGVPLVRHDEHHSSIDLSPIHVFKNLHTFVQLLTNEVLEQCGFGIADIMVRRRVDPSLTPELVTLGLDWVTIYARIDAAENLPFAHHHFANCMQVIFRTLQTERWGGLLFPEFFKSPPTRETPAPSALLFPFAMQEPVREGGHYFLVEHNPAGRFLRITLEDAASPRLQLKHIRHHVVDQAARGSYLANVTLVAEQIHEGMLRECMNNRTEYHVIPAHHRDLFEHLKRCGLDRLEQIKFTWPTDDIQMLLIEKQGGPDAHTESFAMLLREIQLLEDPQVISTLARGAVVEVSAGRFKVFIDLSRYGSCLHFSFDERRSVLFLEDYLAKMAALSRAAEARGGALAGVRLFLIHHITAEVIGLLKAFQMAGCPSIQTFFVKYGGIVPDAYLETLMSLPQDRFRFFGLQKLESRENLTSRYLFSRLFCSPAELAELEKAIFASGADFLGAMRLAAGHLFLAEVQRARKSGEQLLLVEDGGYLAPLLNRFGLEGATVAEVHSHFHLPVPEGEGGGGTLPLAAWLKGTYLGSVEHTRNGYDYNLEVATEFGRLEFPVATIAVSDLKRGPEARECAISILNATENILHRLGSLLSRRNILILGSSGAIGGFLTEELRRRVGPDHLCGVDIAVREGRNGDVAEFPTLDALGERLSRIDTVIGVIGASIFREKHFEEMVLKGRQKEIFFISGSTKTVEFSDLSAAIENLRKGSRRDRPVKVEYHALRDLQTGILQGYRVALVFPADASRNKDLYLLGELMPINFLYYGIPREVVDEVMAQLFTLSCGFVRRQRSAEKLPLNIVAVDRQIDAEAKDICRKG
jgi:hypothetical protein